MKTDPSSLESVCKALPGVTEDIKWGNDLCFSVGNKMFFVMSLNTDPVSASCKVPSDRFVEYLEMDGIKPAPYLARHHWIFIPDITSRDLTEWKSLILQSYTLVKEKLPARIKKSLE